MISMKIAHIIGYFQPSLGYQEYYLAKKQQEMGHEVHVITSNRYPPYHHYSEVVGSVSKRRIVESGSFCENGVIVHRLPCILEVQYAIVVRGMKKILRQLKPDVVHIHNVDQLAPLFPLFIKDTLGYSVVLDNHRYHSFSLFDPTRGALEEKYMKFLRFLEVFYLVLLKGVFSPLIKKKVDAYISVSPKACKWFSKEFHVPLDKINFVPLGADHKLFKKHLQVRKNVRQFWGIDDDEVLVIYAGKITPDKDVDVLIRAFASLVKRYKKVKLLLLGGAEKEYKLKLMLLVKNCNVRENVLFHHFVRHDELFKYYNAADIGVWPGSPSITIIEAMSTALPVIIPESDNTKHLLEYGNGRMFQRGDVNGLRASLEKLINNKDLRIKCGLLSRKLVLEKLNWDKITKQVLGIYEKTLKPEGWK